MVTQMTLLKLRVSQNKTKQKEMNMGKGPVAGVEGVVDRVGGKIRNMRVIKIHYSHEINCQTVNLSKKKIRNCL